MTSQYHNKLFCEKSQTIKILEALETGVHKFYSYKVALQKPGFRNFFDRMMISEFIAERNITDVKESQFRYRLNKERAELVKMGEPDDVLFSIGLVQRSKRTRDFVYLFSPLVLECVYKLIKGIASAKAARVAAKAAAKESAEHRKKPAKNAVSGASSGRSKRKAKRKKSKSTSHKKTP